MILRSTNQSRGWAVAASRLAALVLAAGLLSACEPVITVHGQALESEDLQLVEVGHSTRNDVQQRLGTPSTSSVFNDKVWYYYSEKVEQVAFFEPEIKERKITAVVFADDGRVENIASYTEADGKDVELVARVTPTAGNELTFFQQLFGNLGRFAKPEGQQTGPRRPPVPH